MILKNQFTPQSMWPYARFELALGVPASIAAWLLVDRADVRWLALPATLATVLGTALSILLAVRVTTTQDVPLTAICVTIERDLLEQLGDPKRPALPQPVNGYLF